MMISQHSHLSHCCPFHKVGHVDLCLHVKTSGIFAHPKINGLKIKDAMFDLDHIRARVTFNPCQYFNVYTSFTAFMLSSV